MPRIEPESLADAETLEHTEVSSAVSVWIDRLLPVLVPAVLIAACALLSPKKEVWVDEVYSYTLVADASFTHALTALYGAADGGMPLYYVLANTFAHCFGTSILLLRLFSSFCMSAGFVILWRLLRARFSTSAAAISMLALGLNSPLVLSENAELRYYGLFFLCSVLVLLAHSKLEDSRDASSGLVLFAWASHVLLIYSHPFGVLYSIAALIGMVIAERRTPRWKLYLLLASSYLTLGPWLPALRRVHDLARPHNWVQPPLPKDVFVVYSISIYCCALVALLVIYIVVTGWKGTEANGRAPRRNMTLFWQSVVFVLIPLMVAAASWVSMPLFVARYFIPSRIGMVVLGAALFDFAFRDFEWTRARLVGVVAVAATLLAFPIYIAQVIPVHIPVKTFAKQMDRGLPVLIEDANLFLPVDYYSNPVSRRFFYVLDWDSAMRSSSLHATLQTKIMMRRRFQHYNEAQVLDTKDALCRFDKFIVVHQPGWAWFHDHIETNPAFRSIPIGVGAVPNTPELYGVMRVGTPQECVATSTGYAYPELAD